MKKSTKAALWSGLVLPGLGHLMLKYYLRGFALAATSLIALSVVVTDAFQQAQLIADHVISGDIAMDPAAISQAMASSADAADGLRANVALAVLVACWLAGIIDSYRLGAIQNTRG